jgi:hypothetical protein
VFGETSLRNIEGVPANKPELDGTIASSKALICPSSWRSHQCLSRKLLGAEESWSMLALVIGERLHDL